MAGYRLALFAALLLVAPWSDARADVVVVTRSATGSGTALGDDIDTPSLSWNGRFVAFASNATDLVAGQVDTPGTLDVFLFDRETNAITLVSRAFNDRLAAGDAKSSGAQVSADGNYVVFGSEARNLVPSFGGAGAQHLFLYDRRADSVRLLTHVAGSSTVAANFGSELGSPAISSDGRYVVYASRATDLVAGLEKSNAHRDVFLYDRVNDRSTLVSHQAANALAGAGGESSGTAINLDGTTVVFGSWAPAANIVAGLTEGNVVDDLFLFDIATGTNALVSRSAGSAQVTANKRSYSPMLDAPGKTVAYESTSTDLVAGQVDTNNGGDVFVFDRVAGTTTLASHVPGSAVTTGTRSALRPTISSDGMITVFNSSSADLYGRSGNDLHVYRHDRRTNVLNLVTYAVGSTVAADESAASFSMSGDGRRIAINSGATNLVAGQLDENGLGDAFIWDADIGKMFVVTTVPGSSLRTGDGHTKSTYISGDGTVGVFTSLATNLAATDSNNEEDLFLWHKPRSGGRRRAAGR